MLTDLAKFNDSLCDCPFRRLVCVAAEERVGKKLDLITRAQRQWFLLLFVTLS